MTQKVKVCRRCSVPKAPDDYYPRHATCIECRRTECREYYYRNRKPPMPRTKTDPEILRLRQRAAAFLRRHGITEEERDAIFEAQGRRCAICGGTESYGSGWCTDHDHACCSDNRGCGKCIRGILCYRCNTLLGHAKDNVETLHSAIEYLTKWAGERENG